MVYTSPYHGYMVEPDDPSTPSNHCQKCGAFITTTNYQAVEWKVPLTHDDEGNVTAWETDGEFVRICKKCGTKQDD